MRNVRVASGLAGAVLACAVALPVSAAGYLKVGDIKGESTDAGHKDWIVIESMSSQVGASYDARGRLASRSSRGTGAAGMLTVTKSFDKASPVLTEAVTKGRRIGEVELELCGADNQCTQLVLRNVVVERYSLTRSGEELTLNYAKIEWSPAKPVAAVNAERRIPEQLRHRDR